MGANAKPQVPALLGLVARKSGKHGDAGLFSSLGSPGTCKRDQGESPPSASWVATPNSPNFKWSRLIQDRLALCACGEGAVDPTWGLHRAPKCGQ